MKEKPDPVTELKLKPPASMAAPNDLANLIPAASHIQLPAERFRSGETWNENRIHSLAMYCVDGRWGEAFDDFCHRSLMIPRYDRFAVPGGPAWLVASQHGAAPSADANSAIHAALSSAAWEQLSLLVRAHELQRIILIGHYGCAFYADRLGLDAEGCLPVQLEDLKLARAAVKSRFPRVSVEAYLAMRQGERLSFHGNV